MSDIIYLDHNATTPMRPEVLEAMLPHLSGGCGNPSSVHRLGQEARKALEDAREEIAALLGAKPVEIIFTSGGTESNNLALHGLRTGHGELITSTVEHHSVLRVAERMVQSGVMVQDCPVNPQGLIKTEELARMIHAGTLVSIQHANNETGVIQEIAALSRMAHDAGALFHTDACQSVGKIPVSFHALGIDALSFAAHKFYGPKGIGGLIVKTSVELEPVMSGGRQERGRRPGTENVAGAVGMARALRLAIEEMDSVMKQLAELRRRFIGEMHARFPQVVIHGDGAPVLENTVNAGFPGLEAQDIVMGLDLQGVMISAGAACDSGAIETSHVIRALGVPEDVAAGSVRFSFGRETTWGELEQALEALGRTVGALAG